jgi:hypothetical protein
VPTFRGVSSATGRSNIRQHPDRPLRPLRPEPRSFWTLAHDLDISDLAGMLCIEQNDEWLVGRAYLSAESISEVLSSQEQNSQQSTTEQRRNLNQKEKEVAQLQPA